jgi:hypothetical protein
MPGILSGACNGFAATILDMTTQRFLRPRPVDGPGLVSLR